MMISCDLPQEMKKQIERKQKKLESDLNDIKNILSRSQKKESEQIRDDK